MKQIDFERLPQLIYQLQLLSNAIPRVGATGAGMRLYHEAVNALEVKLTGQLQARVLKSSGTVSLVLAGLRASATSGLPGALHNWIGAARKKLAERETGQ